MDHMVQCYEQHLNVVEAMKLSFIVSKQKIHTKEKDTYLNCKFSHNHYRDHKRLSPHIKLRLQVNLQWFFYNFSINFYRMNNIPYALNSH